MELCKKKLKKITSIYRPPQTKYSFSFTNNGHLCKYPHVILQALPSTYVLHHYKQNVFFHPQIMAIFANTRMFFTSAPLYILCTPLQTKCIFSFTNNGHHLKCLCYGSCNPGSFLSIYPSFYCGPNTNKVHICIHK